MLTVGKRVVAGKNPIAVGDFHGFLHGNCEDTEQLNKLKYIYVEEGA